MTKSETIAWMENEINFWSLKVLDLERERSRIPRYHCMYNEENNNILLRKIAGLQGWISGMRRAIVIVKTGLHSLDPIEETLKPKRQ